MFVSGCSKRVGVDNLHLLGDGRTHRAQLHTNFKAINSILLKGYFLCDIWSELISIRINKR